MPRRFFDNSLTDHLVGAHGAFRAALYLGERLQIVKRILGEPPPAGYAQLLQSADIIHGGRPSFFRSADNNENREL